MRLLAGLSMLLWSVQAVADGDENARNAVDTKVVRAVRAATPPVIDGRLDDPIWANAAMVEDLHEIKPDEFTEPSEKTLVYLLYDDEALYVGARLYDREPREVRASVMRQGASVVPDDTFVVMLDPFDRGRSGYIFEVNPNGIRSEGLFENTTNLNFDWTGIWRGSGSVDDEGWTAEMAIPFKTLSFDPDDETWGLNLTRFIRRRDERIGWVSHNRDQNPSSFGRVTGLEGISQGLGLDIVPGMSVSNTKDFTTGESSTTDWEPSLDAFYKITPALTASLTVNTDFSGTAVDERQINLTRFGLFFPEQRLFFLQDTDIFEFGRIAARSDFTNVTTFASVNQENGRPFFSRRVGLSDAGEPVDLIVGGKLTGRAGPVDMGVLNILQDDFGDVDATNLFVARVATDVLKESSIGAIVTNGDPATNLDNTLIGIDFRYLNTRLGANRTLDGAAWYQQSNTEGVDGDDAAFGLSLEMPNSDGWRGGLAYKELGENFNPALGFINRAGIQDYTAFGGYTYRPADSFLRIIFAGVDVQRIEDTDGNLESQKMTLRLPEFENQVGDELKFRYNLFEERLTAPFEISDGVIIPVGDYSFEEWGVILNTAQQRKLSFSFFVFDGDFFDGNRLQLDGGMTWRPSKYFEFDVSYNFNDIDLPQGDFITRLMQLRANIAFTSAWSWNNFLQYDNVSDTIGINSILRWNPEAGREVALVFNRLLEDDDENSSFKSRFSELTAKVSYTFRF